MGEYHDDRRVFLFMDGKRRAISNDYAHLIVEAEPDEEVAAEAAQYFAKNLTRKTAAPAAKKKKTATKRKTATKKKATKKKAAAPKAE